MECDSFKHEADYDEYIKDLDNWAVGDAYDELVELPDNLQEIVDESEVEYGQYEVEPEAFNVYACFGDVDLEEFSDFYLFDSEDFLSEGDEGNEKKHSNEWDEKLSEWFNPNKEHDVRKAVCYIGYGYYTLKIDNTEFRYYLAVKCNKEGKVEKFINNYLESY